MPTERLLHLMATDKAHRVSYSSRSEIVSDSRQMGAVGVVQGTRLEKVVDDAPVSRSECNQPLDVDSEESDVALKGYMDLLLPADQE